MKHLTEQTCIYFYEQDLKDLLLYPIKKHIQQQVIQSGKNIFQWKEKEDLRLYDSDDNYIMLYNPR